MPKPTRPIAGGLLPPGGVRLSDAQRLTPFQNETCIALAVKTMPAGNADLDHRGLIGKPPPTPVRRAGPSIATATSGQAVPAPARGAAGCARRYVPGVARVMTPQARRSPELPLGSVC
jgi:hypothetical protein